MNPSQAGQQSRPDPQQGLHQSRPVGLIHQQRPPSPRQNHPVLPSSTGAFISPHSSSHNLPQQQHHLQHPQTSQHTPYIGPAAGNFSHHPGEAAYFAHPSPYSTSSAAGSYASSEPGESMAATQAVLNRQPYPPMSNYHTPQSHSPVSMQSPQTDAHPGRSMYAMQTMPHTMHYPQHYPMQAPQQPTNYGYYPGTSHQSMPGASGMLMSHTPTHQQPQQLPQSGHHHLHQAQPHSPHEQQSMIDTKMTIPSMQRPPSLVTTSAPHHQQHMLQSQQQHQQYQQQQPQHTQQMHSPSIAEQNEAASNPANPAPGPIPATTPMVIQTDNNGTQWIAFDYSRDRIKMQYRIRCDVETVNVDELTPEFKSSNCVYPRACVSKEEYKGNRHFYESECNQVGWALAQLNPSLRDKRGLIQRAVDSWRNSNQDHKLRSRRVRRMNKINHRNKTPTSTTNPYSAPAGPSALNAMPGSHNMPPGRAYSLGSGISPTHHHQSDGSEASGGNGVTAGTVYLGGKNARMRSQSSAGAMLSTSSSTPRSLPKSDVPYAQLPSQGVAAPAPPTPTSAEGGPVLPMSSESASAQPEPVESKDALHERLYGAVAQDKVRKFVQLTSHEVDKSGKKLRISTRFDSKEYSGLPDDIREANSLFHRSFFPVAPPSQHIKWPINQRSDYFLDVDENDDPTLIGIAPTTGQPLVRVDTHHGPVDLPVPRLTRSRREHECLVNELTQRMIAGQLKYSGQTQTNQRALDECRKHAAAQFIEDCKTQPELKEIGIPTHMQVRPGKTRWLARKERLIQVTSD